MLGNSYYYINEKNDLYMWGANTYGQLGTGKKNSIQPPTKVAGDLKFSEVSSGVNHTLGITVDGDLYAWGNNGNNVLGTGDTEEKLIPTKISNLKFKKIASGYIHSAGITVDGDLYTWGYNAYGNLGDGTTVNKSTPTKIGNLKWKDISLGYYHALGILENGDLYAWGYNAQSQIGNNNTTIVSTPLKITTLKWEKVDTQSLSSFGITTDGHLYGWGSNAQGNLSYNNANGLGVYANVKSPLRITNYIFKDISSGSNFSIGTTKAGQVLGWGLNSSSQLGFREIHSLKSPMVLHPHANTYAWDKIISLGSGSLGITTDGDLYGWGYNGQGQLLDGTLVNKEYPVKIAKEQFNEYHNKTVILHNNSYKTLQKVSTIVKKDGETSALMNNFLNMTGIENDSFIVKESNYTNPITRVWKAFDNSTSTHFQATGKHCYIDIIGKNKKIKLTSFSIRPTANVVIQASPSTFSILARNSDDENWVTIQNFSNSAWTANVFVNFDMNRIESFQQIRFLITNNISNTSNNINAIAIGDIRLNGHLVDLVEEESFVYSDNLLEIEGFDGSKTAFLEHGMETLEGFERAVKNSPSQNMFLRASSSDDKTFSTKIDFTNKKNITKIFVEVE